MNKQELASKIWASANKMRSKIEASEYKDYILGFIFYKFLSEKEEKFLFTEGWEKSDFENELVEGENTEYIQRNIGYFISYDNLFSTWLSKKSDFDVSNVTDALSAFNRLIYYSEEDGKTKVDYRPVFKDIFKTLQSGLDKLGENSAARTKAIRELIELIKDIPMDDKQDYDVLGFIYEYLISNFAANAGKKAGEFYTPHEVSLLMSEIIANHLKYREEIEIYDPTSGSGSLLINIGKSMAKQMKDPNKIKYYAQEVIENTYNLTRMNLIMRGIEPSNIVTRCGDTLDKDWPFFDVNHTYKALYLDAVVSNPPYSQPWDPLSHQGDVRYANFGYAPKSKADYAFLLHDLYHVKPNGIMTIVLPHGVLFRGGEEEKIRTQLIENDHIETIIGLPANIFYGTGIPTIIMVLKQKRDDSDVLFIDASKHFVKDGKKNKLQASDIRRIMDSIIERKNDPKFDKFSRLVSKQEIRDNGYNLNIPRYVDSTDDIETFDLYATMYGGIPNSEIAKYNKFFDVFPSLKDELFEVQKDKPYSFLRVENVERIISVNKDVIEFKEKFKSAFSNLEFFLHNELINDPMKVIIYREENTIVEYIFDCLKQETIIDKYEIYQILDDQYKKIAQDLEVIQTEGLKAITQVDPNMIIKKKDNKDIEVQEGWVGHIIPFDLVQSKFLVDDYKKVEEINNRLNEISNEYSEIIESFNDEEKGSGDDAITNEDDTAFVGKAINKKAKYIIDNIENDEIKTLNEYSTLEKNDKIKFISVHTEIDWSSIDGYRNGVIGKNDIKKHISLIKQNYNFDNESFEYKVLKVSKLMEEEKKLKKEFDNLNKELHEKTKSTIENLNIDEYLKLLDIKWNHPIIEGILNLSNELINYFTQKITKLSKKYEYTLLDTNKEIEETEKSLSSILDDLTGDEFDMKAIEGLKKMLGGGDDE